MCLFLCTHKKKEEEENRERARERGERNAMPVINGDSFLQFNHSRVKRNILFEIAKETTTTTNTKKKKKQQREVR